MGRITSYNVCYTKLLRSYKNAIASYAKGGMLEARGRAALQAEAAAARTQRLVTARRSRPLDAAWVADCLNRVRPGDGVVSYNFV